MDWRLGYSVVKRLLCPVRGKSVLDYGCGDGRFCRLLRDRGARVFGVDIDDDVIDKARSASSESISYHVIKSGELSVIPSQSVDLAVSTFVLCCVQHNAEMARIAEAVYARVRPGGCYVLCEPHPDGVNRHFYSMQRTARGEPASGAPLQVKVLGGGTINDFWHSQGDYLEALQEAGFIIEHMLEPTMRDYPDEPYWKDERDHPPFLILRARR
jgi:SAM-dependent methyltransferase